MMRGRGRGRGSSGPRPVARDDEGNALPTEENTGPPPLYPEVEPLPALPSEVDLQKAEQLVKILSNMNSNYQNSPYYISSENESDIHHTREALTPDILVKSLYIPPELFGGYQRGKKTRMGARKKARLDNASALDISLSRIEELAKWEGKDEAPEAIATMDSIMEEKDENEEDQQDDMYDEDDVFGNDDDPFQQYDDDEEYDEPDADGADDPYF